MSNIVQTNYQTGNSGFSENKSLSVDTNRIISKTDFINLVHSIIKGDYSKLKTYYEQGYDLIRHFDVNPIFCDDNSINDKVVVSLIDSSLSNNAEWLNEMSMTPVERYLYSQITLEASIDIDILESLLLLNWRLQICDVEDFLHRNVEKIPQDNIHDSEMCDLEDVGKQFPLEISKVDFEDIFPYLTSHVDTSDISDSNKLHLSTSRLVQSEDMVGTQDTCALVDLNPVETNASCTTNSELKPKKYMGDILLLMYIQATHISQTDDVIDLLNAFCDPNLYRKDLLIRYLAASSHYDLDVIVKLIEIGGEVNYRYPKQDFFYCFEKEKKCPINPRTSISKMNYETPLSVAVSRKCNTTIFLTLLYSNAQLNVIKEEYYHLLFLYADCMTRIEQVYGDVDKIVFAREDFAVFSPSYDSPMLHIYYEQFCRLKIFKRNHFPSLNVEIYYRLLDDVKSNNFSSLIEVINTGYDVVTNVNMGIEHFDTTFLHYACKFGHDASIIYLLNCGASTNLQDLNNPQYISEYIGTSPILYYLSETNTNKRPEILKVLLECGAHHLISGVRNAPGLLEWYFKKNTVHDFEIVKQLMDPRHCNTNNHNLMTNNILQVYLTFAAEYDTEFLSKLILRYPNDKFSTQWWMEAVKRSCTRQFFHHLLLFRADLSQMHKSDQFFLYPYVKKMVFNPKTNKMTAIFPNNHEFIAFNLELSDESLSSQLGLVASTFLDDLRNRKRMRLLNDSNLFYLFSHPNSNDNSLLQPEDKIMMDSDCILSLKTSNPIVEFLNYAFNQGYYELVKFIIEEGQVNSFFDSSNASVDVLNVSFQNPNRSFSQHIYQVVKHLLIYGFDQLDVTPYTNPNISYADTFSFLLSYLSCIPKNVLFTNIQIVIVKMWKLLMKSGINVSLEIVNGGETVLHNVFNFESNKLLMYVLLENTIYFNVPITNFISREISYKPSNQKLHTLITYISHYFDLESLIIDAFLEVKISELDKIH